jgi:hypothetical protein
MANRPNKELQELRETRVALQSVEDDPELNFLASGDAMTRAYWRSGDAPGEDAAHAQRRAAGRYRMVEAAEALALEDAQAPFERQPQDKASAARLSREMDHAREWLAKLKRVALSGALPVYMPGREGRHTYNGDKYVRDFQEETYWNDLNAWLEKNEPRVRFRFPSPPQIEVDSNSLSDVGNDDTTIQARVKAWNIFTPDWQEIRQTGGLQLVSLCALSVGLHPWFAQPEWVLRVARPFFLGELDDVCCPRPQEAAEYAQRLGTFLERLHVAPTNIEPLGTLPAATSEADGERTYVRVVDFVTWANGIGWSLPAEFSRFPTAEAVAQVDAASGAVDSRGQEVIGVASADQGENPGPTWKAQVIALADEFVRGYSGVGMPSKSGVIASNVARMAKERRITNTRGKELTAETIYREALQNWTPPN